MTETSPVDPTIAATTAPEATTATALGPIGALTSGEAGAATTAAAAPKVEVFKTEDFNTAAKVGELFVVGNPNKAPSDEHVIQVIPRPEGVTVVDARNDSKSKDIQVWVRTERQFFSPEDFQKPEKVGNLFVVDDPKKAPGPEYVRRRIPRPGGNVWVDSRKDPNSKDIEVWVHHEHADMPAPISDAEQLAHDMEAFKVNGAFPRGESRAVLEFVAKYAGGERMARQKLEAIVMQMKSSADVAERALGYDFEIEMQSQNMYVIQAELSEINRQLAEPSLPDGEQKNELLRQQIELQKKLEPLEGHINTLKMRRAKYCKGRFIKKETRMDGSVVDIHEDPPGNMVQGAAEALFFNINAFPSPEEEGITDIEKANRTAAIEARRNEMRANPLKFARDGFKSMIDAKKHGNSEPMDAFLQKFQEHERQQVKKMLETEALTIFTMKFWLSLLGVFGKEALKYAWKHRKKLGLQEE